MQPNFITNTDRQAQVLKVLEERERIALSDLTALFQVSEATARRDLDSLAEQGKVQRVHGGAVLLRHSASEPPLLERSREQASEKERIGQAAAALVREGETVFLGSGTTVLEAARALRGMRNLTVITNSLPVVNAFAGVDGVTVICLGGMLRSSELSFIGHITEQALAEVRADKVFIGTRAISLEHGLTHEYLPETMTDRAILKVGKEITVLADHTKFGCADTVLLAPLEHIHSLVTDSEAPKDFLEALEQQGIQVIVA